ncbi:MAG: hypothetical protein HY873_02085 [Chloroflexi bacterium]|nr:hypothetical protein [Chloroflexota bacterium]
MKERSDKRASSSWWLRIAASSILLVGAGAAFACSDDEDKADAGATKPAATAAATKAATGDEGAIEATAQTVFASWNANDLAAFREVVSDAGLVSIFGEDRYTLEEVLAELPNFFGSEQISNITVSNVSLSGPTATADVQFAVSNAYEKNRWTLSKVGAGWKVDKEEDLAVEVPSGRTLVHVDANEFAFGADISAIDADAAFELSNVGKQEHEIGIGRITADANIDDLIQLLAADESGNDVPGFEFLGAVSAEPGATKNLVFVEPLSPGRYVMLCFLSDTSQGEDGRPHATLGMKKEFTIE